MDTSRRRKRSDQDAVAGTSAGSSKKNKTSSTTDGLELKEICVTAAAIKLIEFSKNQVNDIEACKEALKGFVDTLKNYLVVWTKVKNFNFDENTMRSEIYRLLKNLPKQLDTKVSLVEEELDPKCHGNLLFENNIFAFLIKSTIDDDYTFLSISNYSVPGDKLIQCPIIISFITLEKFISISYRLKYKEGDHDIIFSLGVEHPDIGGTFEFGPDNADQHWAMWLELIDRRQRALSVLFESG